MLGNVWATVWYHIYYYRACYYVVIFNSYQLSNFDRNGCFTGLVAGWGSLARVSLLGVEQNPTYFFYSSS